MVDGDVARLKEIFFAEMERMERQGLGEITVWDVVCNVLSKKGDTLLITLLADLPIIDDIVRGFSLYALSKRWGISSKDIFSVAKTWGFRIVNKSFDLDPNEIYIENMDEQDFLDSYAMVSPVVPSFSDVRTAIDNIQHYKDILYFLEWSESNGQT